MHMYVNPLPSLFPLFIRNKQKFRTQGNSLMLRQLSSNKVWNLGYMYTTWEVWERKITFLHDVIYERFPILIFFCSCNYSAPSRISLEVHNCKHDEAKIYDCSICQKSFARSEYKRDPKSSNFKWSKMAQIANVILLASLDCLMYVPGLGIRCLRSLDRSLIA